MAATFGELIAECAVLVDYQDTRTDSVLRSLAVSALKKLSLVRQPWAEESFTLTTVAAQNEYVRNQDGVPATFLHALDAWPLVSGQRTKGPLRLMTAREAKTNLDQQIVGYARWKRGGFRLAGKVLGGEQLDFDYLVDGTIDAATGSPVATDSDSAANVWIAEGDAVKAWVLSYYFGVIAKNPEAAAPWATLLEDLAGYGPELEAAATPFVVAEGVL